MGAKEDAPAFVRRAIVPFSRIFLEHHLGIDRIIHGGYRAETDEFFLVIEDARLNEIPVGGIPPALLLEAFKDEHGSIRFGVPLPEREDAED